MKKPIVLLDLLTLENAATFIIAPILADVTNESVIFVI